MTTETIIYASAKVGFGLSLGGYAAYCFISLANSGAKIAGKLIGTTIAKAKGKA